MASRGREASYPRDLPDEQWAVLAPDLGQQTGPGRPPPLDLRAVVNALLPSAAGGSVAVPAARLPALDGGALLLRPLDAGRHLGGNKPPPGGAGTPAAGPPGAAPGGDHRQPEPQDDGGGRGTRLRWGKQGAPDASGTLWSIRRSPCSRCSWSERTAGTATRHVGCLATSRRAGQRSRRSGRPKATRASWAPGGGPSTAGSWSASSRAWSKQALQSCRAAG